MNKIKSLIPNGGKDGFLKNMSELVEEYRTDNIECFCLVYQRKEDASMRTYFMNRDSPYLLSTLIRLILDISNAYSTAAISIKEFE